MSEAVLADIIGTPSGLPLSASGPEGGTASPILARAIVFGGLVLKDADSEGNVMDFPRLHVVWGWTRASCKDSCMLPYVWADVPGFAVCVKRPLRSAIPCARIATADVAKMQSREERKRTSKLVFMTQPRKLGCRAKWGHPTYL